MRAKEHAAPSRTEPLGRGASKFVGEKARVIADQKSRLRVPAANMPGNRCRGDAHAGEREFVANHGAPAGCAEMDRVARHARVLYLGARALGCKKAQPRDRKE